VLIIDRPTLLAALAAVSPRLRPRPAVSFVRPRPALGHLVAGLPVRNPPLPPISKWLTVPRAPRA